MSKLSQAFESTEELFGYSEDAQSTPLPGKEIYSDVNERASIEPLPVYVREKNTRYSTLNKAPDTPDEYTFIAGGSEADCQDYVRDFADDDIPLNQEFLVIHSIRKVSSQVKIFFSQMRFENGCLVGVNAEADVSFVWGQEELTLCGGSFPIASPPDSQDWSSPI